MKLTHDKLIYLGMELIEGVYFPPRQMDTQKYIDVHREEMDSLSMTEKFALFHVDIRLSKDYPKLFKRTWRKRNKAICIAMTRSIDLADKFLNEA